MEKIPTNLPEKFNIEEDNFSKEKLSHLFSENKFEYIIDNIDQFKLVEDETNIILKIVEIAEYSKKDYYFNECLEKFKNLNHKEIANKFIESGKGSLVAKNLEKFEGLDKETEIKIIEERRQYFDIASLNKFKNLNNKEIANKLIELKVGYLVAENLEKFEGLDNDVANNLIECGQGDSVARNLEKFKDLNHQEIANKLIESGEGDSVASNLERFEGLDHNVIASKILESKSNYSLRKEYTTLGGKYIDTKIPFNGKGKPYNLNSIIKNLEKFEGLGQEIAIKLIESGEGRYVVKNLEKFEGLDYKEIINKLIESNSNYSLWKGSHFGKETYHENDFLDNPDKSINLNSIADNLEKFKEIDNDLIIKIIDAGFGSMIIDKIQENKINNFTGINYKEIIYKLIDSKLGDKVGYILNKFPGLDHSEIALKMIESGNVNSVRWYVESSQDQRLNQDIAFKLIEYKESTTVAKNLDKFIDCNHNEIANKIIEFGDVKSLIYDIEKFRNLNCDIALKIIKAGFLFDADSLSSFKLSPQELYEGVKEIYTDYILNIEQKFSRLSEQAIKSPELLINILALKNNFPKIEKQVNQNPFLLTALEDNPRYGSKLILKYLEFNKTSKENIKELFDIKEEIVKDNLGIDVDSIEYRKLVQEKLSKYKNNHKILEEIENRGVNVDNWLNYNKQINFTLGEQEDVKFSDKIRTPISRIKETLNKYQESIVSVLSDYKKELQSSSIANPESIELEEKIKKQEIKISEETDQKRKEGMEKGLNSLKSKLETLKPIDSWTKIQSDIFRLKSMIDNIFKFHDACVLNELDLENIKDNKELIKKKDELEKNKMQLKNNLKEFETFFDSYEDKLKELTNSSLGETRSLSLLQELKERMGEDLSHYDTDKNTLNNIFKDEDNDSNDLKGREMRISISSRSPEDLYLGNYCPCCICVESKHHGDESPIADYVTDLGIQNIVVYDEKKNIPVVACWSFIGQNSKNGDPILVIDNIEANTEYTNNYPEQLKEVISKFIINYAETSNIKEIAQGPHNNDLEVFSLGEVGKKLGGIYNRRSGYFLEAEKDEDDEEENNEEEFYEPTEEEVAAELIQNYKPNQKGTSISNIIDKNSLEALERIKNNLNK